MRIKRFVGVAYQECFVKKHVVYMLYTVSQSSGISLQGVSHLVCASLCRMRSCLFLSGQGPSRKGSNC